jgi:hypothetical protein
MAVTAERPAPYAPASAVQEVITRYRNRGLQTPINGEVLRRAGVSDSLIPRTLQALQTLDLIQQDGMPTPVLEGLRLAPEAEFKKRQEDWLKAAYADVFAFVDPAQDDETRIRDAFRSYGPIGQQDRMVSLFTGLCNAAGLMPAKPEQRPRQQAAVTPRRRTAAKKVATAEAGMTPGRGTRSNGSADSQGVGMKGVPAPLAGLFAALPSAEAGWNTASRDKFLATFETVLDFCIPIIEDTGVGKNNGGT